MVPKNQLIYLETLVAGILTDHVGAVNMEAHFAKAIVVNCGDCNEFFYGFISVVSCYTK